MVDRERDVRRERLPYGLAVLPALGDCEHLEVVLDRVRDPVQDARALGDRGLAPSVLCGVRRVERKVDVLGRRARDLRERLTGRRCHVLGVLPLHRSDPVAADEVVVARLQLDGTVVVSRSREDRDLLDGCHDSPSVGPTSRWMRLRLDHRSRRAPSHRVQHGSGCGKSTTVQVARVEIRDPTGLQRSEPAGTCSPMRSAARSNVGNEGDEG